MILGFQWTRWREVLRPNARKPTCQLAKNQGKHSMKQFGPKALSTEVGNSLKRWGTDVQQKVVRSNPLTLYLLSWVKASITPYSIYSNKLGPLMWHYYYHYYYFFSPTGWKNQATVWKITTKQPRYELCQTNITKYNNNNNEAMYRAAKTIWYSFFLSESKR